MSDARKRSCARLRAQPTTVIPINAMWLDYHGTVVFRKPGAVKAAAEQALGRTIAESDKEAEVLVEKARLDLDQAVIDGQTQGIIGWADYNKLAFFKYQCSDAEANRMSELVCDEANYAFSKNRLQFIKWLLRRFPPNSAEGRHVLTASNADYSVLSAYLEKHGLLNKITPVGADMLQVYKPRPEFFERLIDMTKVPPEKTLFVANSWRNDIQAARLGVNVVVVLPPSVTLTAKEIMSRVGKIKGQVFFARSLKAAREIVERYFFQTR